MSVSACLCECASWYMSPCDCVCVVCVFMCDGCSEKPLQVVDHYSAQVLCKRGIGGGFRMRSGLLLENHLLGALVKPFCEHSLAAPSPSLLTSAFAIALTVSPAIKVALRKSVFVCRKPGYEYLKTDGVCAYGGSGTTLALEACSILQAAAECLLRIGAQGSSYLLNTKWRNN